MERFSLSPAYPPAEQARVYGVQPVWFIVEPRRDQSIHIGALIETVLPLSQARQAYEQGAQEHTRGKIVLHVAS